MIYKSSLPLSEVIERFIDYRGKTPKKTNKGIPLITAKIIKNGRIQKPNEYISEESYQQWMTRGFPNVGDIVLTTEAPLGEVAQIHDASMALAQRVITLRGKDGILDNTYLRYVLQSSKVQHELRSRATGTTVLGIKSSELKKVEIPLQPIDKQKKIGHVLSTIDQKIDVNTEINELLESIAQSLFTSWFIDFDPVHAKKNALDSGLNSAQAERAAMAVIAGICGSSEFAENFKDMEDKLSQKLAKMTKEKQEELASIASLFPCEFEDSEFGEIPKGWEETELGEIATNVRDNRNTHQLSLEDAYVGLEHIERHHLFIKQNATAENVESNKSAFDKHDILFGKLRPYFHKVCIPDFSGVCSTDILVIREKIPKHKCFVLFTVFQDAFVEFSNLRSTGTRMPRASWPDMASYKLILPPEAIMDKFQAIATSFLEKGFCNLLENKNLASVRDLLLPKLISDEIDLSEVSID